MSGHTDRSRIVRNVRQDNSVRADADIVADANSAQNDRADAELDVVANLWSIVIGVSRPYAYVLPESAVAANGCACANHDAAKMIYTQPRANGCPTGQMNANDQGDNCVKNQMCSPQNLPEERYSDSTEPLAQSIRQNGKDRGLKKSGDAAPGVATKIFAEIS